MEYSADYIRLYNLFHRCKGCRVRVKPGTPYSSWCLMHPNCRIHTDDLDRTTDFLRLQELQEVYDFEVEVEEEFDLENAAYDDSSGEVRLVLFSGLG